MSRNEDQFFLLFPSMLVWCGNWDAEIEIITLYLGLQIISHDLFSFPDSRLKMM